MASAVARMAPDPVTLTVDLRSYTVVGVTPNAAVLWDCRVPGELVGRSLASLLATSDVVIAERLNPQSAHRGRPYYATIAAPRGGRIMIAISPREGSPARGKVVILDVVPVDSGRLSLAQRAKVFGEIGGQLEEERNNLDAVFQAAPVGLLLVNDATYVEKANQQLFALFGRPVAEVFGGRFGDLFGCAVPVREGVSCGEGRACATCAIRNGMNSVIATGEAIAGAELSHDFSVGGEEVRKWLKVTASRVQIGGRRFAMVAMDDITRRVEMEQRLAVLSYTDELSGLRNRRSILELLAHECDTLKSRGGQTSLAMLDIDNFKAYNDRFGHIVGDLAIRAFGRALSAGLRLADAAGRYGGEEFMVLFPGATPAQAREALLRVRAHLVDPGTLPVGAAFTFSGGVAGITADLAAARDPADLIGLADTLLYRAKDAGKDRILITGE